MSGGIAGFFGSMLGVGGGVIMVPMLTCKPLELQAMPLSLPARVCTSPIIPRPATRANSTVQHHASSRSGFLVQARFASATSLVAVVGTGGSVRPRASTASLNSKPMSEFEPQNEHQRLTCSHQQNTQPTPTDP
jgi:hypothetical protein